MGNKYELTEETMKFQSVTLHRIRALKSFGGVRAGELGGWIEGYRNLDQDGECWVYGNARVYDNALVYGNAQICDIAWVYENARVFGDAQVLENAQVYGNAMVYKDAQIFENAKVFGNAQVFGNESTTYDAIAYGNSCVCGNAKVFGNAMVCGYALVSGDAWIYEDAQVFGKARIRGNARICGNAQIEKETDYLTIGPIGIRNEFITFMREEGNEILVRRGCFLGELDDFMKKVTKTHGDNQHGRSYRAAIELAKIQLLGEEQDGKQV